MSSRISFPFLLRHVLLTAALAATSGICLAETTPPPVPGVSGGTFVQGFLGLLVILGLLMVSLYALRKYGGRMTGASTAGMKVISGLPVGTRERILLLEVGDTWLVVGVTSTQIRTLHCMPKGTLPELGPMTATPFAAWLNKATERQKP